MAITRLYPSRYDPTHATYNRPHFEALAAEVELDLVVAVPWYQKKLHAFESNFEHRASGSRSFPTFWYPPRIMEKQRGRYFLQSIRSIVRRLPPPDVIYATWLCPDGVAAVELGKELGKPVVVKAVGSDIHSVKGHQREMTLNTLAEADGVITVSRALATGAVKMGANDKNTQVIYNGVDQQQFDLIDEVEARNAVNLPLNTVLFCCVARLHPVKALDTLIMAFAKVNIPDAQLYLLGPGGELERLQGVARQSGAGERIHFVGEVAFEKIPLWMNAATAVVLSSRNEGIPNVLIEALSCGRPVVSTDVGGISEVIEQGVHGELVDPGDIQGLSDALYATATKSWNREALRQSVGQYTWHSNARQTALCLSEAVQEKNLDS